MITNENIITLNSYLQYAGLSGTFSGPLAKYLKIVLRENQNLNLVSRKLDVDTLIIEHFYDCLAGHSYFKEAASVTDIGTGGGFPGMLLAIVFPEKHFVLIDKSPKKVKYLQSAIEEMELKNVTARQGVINDAKIETEAITCRGFKSIKEILTFTKPFFKKGGSYILYKGRRERIDQELKEAEKRFAFKADIQTIAEKVNKERHIITLERVGK